MKDDVLVLKMPSFLVLELYRQAIVPQMDTQGIIVEISDKREGKFR